MSEEFDYEIDPKKRELFTRILCYSEEHLDAMGSAITDAGLSEQVVAILMFEETDEEE